MSAIPLLIELPPHGPVTIDRTRTAEPLTLGVPLPAGWARDVSALRVLDGSGTVKPSQFHVLERWPDGFLRWLLVDLQASVDSSGSALWSLIVAPELGGARHPEPIESQTVPGGVVMQSGPHRVACVPSEHGLVHASFGDDAGHNLRVTATDDNGRDCRVEVSSCRLEQHGAFRSVVCVSGHLSAIDADAPLLDLTVRLEVFAGHPVIRAQIGVTNPRRAQHPGGYWDLGDPGSVFIRSLVVRWQSVSAEADRLWLSPETGLSMEPVQAPVAIHQESSGGVRWDSTAHVDRHGHVVPRYRGYEIRSANGSRSGERSTPILLSRSEVRVSAVAMREFWQQFPKRLEGQPAGEISMALFPDIGSLHELQGGERKTHEICLAFGQDRITRTPLEWVRVPLRGRTTPAWYAHAQAVSGLQPAADDAEGYESLIRAGVEGLDSFVAKREIVDEYGWRHFGDLYADHEAVFHTGPHPLVSHYNNQYDAIAGFAAQFMRSGDWRWFELCDDLSSHVKDIDIYHTSRDKSAYNGGMFWHTYHHIDAGTSTHRCYPAASKVGGGGPSSEHNYNTGLLLHYFLTGDPDSRDAAIGLGRWVVEMDDGTKTIFRWLARGDTGLASASGSMDYHGPGRGSGNSLLTLINAHRLSGDPALLAKCEGLIRRCIHPADDIESRQLLDTERRWFYTVFLQALGRYLEYKADIGQVDGMYAYARSSLLHYARWMSEHEYPYLDCPEKLEYPNETWAAQDLRKALVFRWAARYVHDAEHAARFRERESHFWREGLTRLSAFQTRTLTRPLVLALVLGTLAPGRPALPVGPQFDYGRPAVFLAQRTSAKRVLMSVALAVAGAFLMAVFWLATL